MVEKIRQMDFISKIILILMLFSIFLIFMNFGRIYLNKVEQSTYRIVLQGDNPLIVYQEDEYVEPGFIAYNYLNKDKTELVNIKNNVNTNVIGEYEVTYIIQNFFKKNKVIRKVNVVENPLKDVEFTLKGKNKMEIERTKKYVEPGVNVISDKGDFTKNVTITNNVDVNKVGRYEVVYTLRIGNKEKTIKRIVNVVGDKYTANLDNKELTNKDVKIQLTNNLKDFDHFVNPNNIEIYDEYFEFLVNKNGVYEFHLIDINGADELITVKVNNIDKKGPTGVCNSFISGNKTSYVIDATDTSGIEKYVYNEVDYEENNFVIDGIIDEAEVYVYDIVGNKSTFKCNVEYEYIGPTNKVHYKYESDTLKYWIEKFDTYATTHIWVKDAYNQLKVAIPTKRGSLWTGKGIINTEIKKYNYENKGLVSVNASGIVGGGFGKKYYNLKPAWEGSPAIPFYMNKGEVIRDSINTNFPTVYYVTYGMKKNGYLGYYTYTKSENVEANTKVKDTIINDGIKDTFAFRPVLVYDGQTKSTETEKNIRQAICQIDRNNFIFVSNTNSTDERGKGFNFKDLANYLVKLNCKIGFNLDGGGSVNHYYKANNSKLYSIKSSVRGLVDMLYFVEK